MKDKSNRLALWVCGIAVTVVVLFFSPAIRNLLLFGFFDYVLFRAHINISTLVIGIIAGFLAPRKLPLKTVYLYTLAVGLMLFVSVWQMTYSMYERPGLFHQSNPEIIAAIAGISSIVLLFCYVSIGVKVYQLFNKKSRRK